MIGAERTDDGRAFHARAAVTEKVRSPSVVRRVDGMTSVVLEALRRRRREPTSAVKWRVSARYDGAVPIRQRYARTHNRNWILSGTFSQCRSRRSGVMCLSYVLRLPCGEHESSSGVEDRLQRIQLYKCAYKNCIGLHSTELQYVIVNLKDVVLMPPWTF